MEGLLGLSTLDQGPIVPMSNRIQSRCKQSSHRKSGVLGANEKIQNDDAPT